MEIPSSRPPDVSVLALGNWGTALANHLASKGLRVLGWAREAEIVDSINRDRRNPHYLSQVTLNPNFLATIELSHALTAPYVVLAAPSSALSSLVPKLVLSPSTILISAVKGFADDSLCTPLQYAEKYLPGPCHLAALSGPSFAKDIVVQNPAGVVAAASQEEIARKVADLFSSERMRVYLSTDLIGVELGGILKNAIALAVGISDGMGLGESAKAGLITRGLAEMLRLSTALGAEPTTLFGLSGLGDLTMTATCDTSRNRTVGLRLGRGESLPTILATLGSVAEGVRSTPLVARLARSKHVDMPITFELEKLLEGSVGVSQLLQNLMRRPTKREF
jgi:glycerol-3-phosphate dehydrogenase (NAD(P)+)